MGYSKILRASVHGRDACFMYFQINDEALFNVRRPIELKQAV